ncbi:hypothetical protein NDK50_20660 [Paraburkholderia bryophila]|uniref:hypothetical protein n=1 Tax=Paraburkholderia bryophila TaxID=420952 RepID=UPI00234A2BA9|nr:hypothetical protein [Paraburkholderia bryophila]WCM19793.1 hypothetical protein NDK50_20660 [Paraburkholderia bryophila]
MNKINDGPLADDPPDASNGTTVAMPRVMWMTALAVASFASVISLGINLYAGMLRAGTVTEQICTVATSLVAALCMYLAPMLWRFVPTRVRVVLAVLWLLAVGGVLRGQVDVLAFANVHAADERAQTVAVVAVPSVATGPSGRKLMAIEQDIAKASIDLAHVDARRCRGECRPLRLRKVELSAQLTVLNAEADDAKRRATEQDWRRDQVSRVQELSESRRAEPGTALVAPWLGTTEARRDLLMNFVLVVVLEGTACFCWYVVGLGAVATRRAAVGDDRNTTVFELPAIAPMPKPQQGGRDGQDATQAACVEALPVAPSRAVVASARNATVSRLDVVALLPKARLASRVDLSSTDAATGGAKAKAVENDASPSSVTPEDDRLLATIREAVVAGLLKRNLASICEFLGCGQNKATRLNRLYIVRFGHVRTLAEQND